MCTVTVYEQDWPRVLVSTRSVRVSVYFCIHGVYLYSIPPYTCSIRPQYTSVYTMHEYTEFTACGITLVAFREYTLCSKEMI